MSSSTKMDEFKKSMTALEERRRAAGSEMLKMAKDAFGDLVKDIFQQYPALEKFSWTQYTPFFNDGDECYFSANIDPGSIDVNDLNETSVDGSYNVSRTRDYSGKQARDLTPEELHPLHFAQKACSDLLESIGEDQLKAMFGDHQQITVHRDGTVETDEYEHE